MGRPPRVVVRRTYMHMRFHLHHLSLSLFIAHHADTDPDRYLPTAIAHSLRSLSQRLRHCLLFWLLPLPVYRVGGGGTATSHVLLVDGGTFLMLLLLVITLTSIMHIPATLISIPKKRLNINPPSRPLPESPSHGASKREPQSPNPQCVDA